MGGNIIFHIAGRSLDASGLARGEKVSLYSFNGMLVASATSNTDGGSVSFELPESLGAAYIVRTSTGISYKIILK